MIDATNYFIRRSLRIDWYSVYRISSGICSECREINNLSRTHTYKNYISVHWLEKFLLKNSVILS